VPPEDNLKETFYATVQRTRRQRAEAQAGLTYTDIILETRIPIDPYNIFVGDDSYNTNYWAKQIEGLESFKVIRDAAKGVCRVVIVFWPTSVEVERYRISSLIEEFIEVMD
jgi:hypothetical protein